MFLDIKILERGKPSNQQKVVLPLCTSDLIEGGMQKASELSPHSDLVEKKEKVCNLCCSCCFRSSERSWKIVTSKAHSFGFVWTSGPGDGVIWHE